jgi:flagellar biosynthesis protein FlhF
MQIKRFEAKNMTEALRRIKRELGSEAVILSAKDLRRENRLLGISRKIGVEVTAAVDEDVLETGAPARAAAMAVGGQGVSPNTANGMHRPLPSSQLVNRLYTRLNRKGGTSGGNARSASDAGTDTIARDAGPEGVGGKTRAAASAMAIPTESGDTAMGRHLAKSGLSVGALRLEKERHHCVALIGNAGVGKTTTVAKLAARYKYRHKETVGLLALDVRRIGALEQLQMYADSMGLPLAVMRHGEDGPKALEQLRGCRLVLIDCPAVDPNDAAGLSRLQAQLNGLGPVTPLLTLSAGNREEDLLDTARRFADLQPAGVVITKMDLTRSYTDMMNFLCREGRAVYFFSDGPNVPRDLSRATLEGLAERFFQNGRFPAAGDANRNRGYPGAAADADRPEAMVYLANKSSDIFHRPGCKWIRLINQANIVEFHSFAEAVNHRFKPCRYCNPQHLSITGMLSRESAVR